MIKKFLIWIRGWLPPTSKAVIKQNKWLSAQIASEERMIWNLFEQNQVSVRQIEKELLEIKNNIKKLDENDSHIYENLQDIECLFKKNEEKMSQSMQDICGQIENVFFWNNEKDEVYTRVLEKMSEELKEAILQHEERLAIILKEQEAQRAEETSHHKFQMNEVLKKRISQIKRELKDEILLQKEELEGVLREEKRERIEDFRQYKLLMKDKEEIYEQLLSEIKKEWHQFLIEDKAVRETQKQGLEKNAQNTKSIEDKVLDLRTEIIREFRVRRNIKPKQIYTNLTERRALAESFNNIMQEKKLFKLKFLTLIEGLDERSRNEVIRILNRMNKITDGNTKGIDLFTQEEQDELLKIKTDFNDQILEISDSLYCYNGYLLPVKSFDPSVFWSRYGIDRIEHLDKISYGDIIDVGGYVGDTALLFSPLTKQNVYVFEPSPYNFEIIQETIKLNQLKNIKVENMALGKEQGVMPLSLGERNSCNTLVERPGYVYTQKINVPVTSLDEYVKANDLNVGLIKIDVEGAEQIVLNGALETIRKFKPLLLISIYHTGSDFFDIKPMIEELNLGYRFKIFKPVNEAIVMETVLIAEVY